MLNNKVKGEGDLVQADLALLGVIFQPVILNLMGREEMRVINEWLIIGAGFLVMIGLKLKEEQDLTS